MRKLQSKGRFDVPNMSADEYKRYQSEQIRIHNKKMKKMTVGRNIQEYEICAKHMIDYVRPNGKMLCLGTRNEKEKERLSLLLADKNIQVFSQDIAKEAGADYTCDFNELSKHIPGGWDIMFSNSLDHAADATATVADWIKLLNPGGIMVLGFCFVSQVSTGDVCEFTYQSVNDFATKDNEFLEKINDYASYSLNYWTLRKK